MQKIKEQHFNLRSIFLFDGMGAIFSAFFTGIILPSYSSQIGVTENLLYLLATVPLIYSAYSFFCYKMVSVIKPWMLLMIMGANLFYCLLSSIVILFYDSITSIGQILFLIEIIVILCVVGLEIKVYQKHSRT